MAITIRPARNHDAKKIFHFLCELEKRLLDQEAFEFNYRACLADANNIYLVAADESNGAVGFISCHGQILLHHGRMVFEIQELFVTNPYRHKGVGRLLLNGLDECLAQRDHVLLKISTNRKRTGIYRRTQMKK
jgi:(aminoalkyl)phosphonate N-acetyltransferase